MKHIPLTNGYEAIVDDEDYPALSVYRWYAMWSPQVGSAYAVRNGKRVGGGQHQIAMHRVILGAKKGQVVDHRNHDTLDNRRSNLRIVTVRQNSMNRKLNRNNTSGFKGVTRDSFFTNKWRAQIRFNRKLFYLGVFETKEEAAMAYNKMAQQFFGPYAHLNPL